MSQLLLFPDPRPLVERLGKDFFRQAPEGPGVYLMRDAGEAVLYVGKARNLRKRLASYRVANPDRLARRHLRLLRAVQRIELEQCPDERTALAREAELLRRLRPKFNRAGTWPGPPRHLAWRLGASGLELAIVGEIETGWDASGPMGAGASPLRAALLRLLWCALHPDCSLAQLPEGWFHGRHGPVAILARVDASPNEFDSTAELLRGLCLGQATPFLDWVRARTSGRCLPFETAVRDADLEFVTDFGDRQLRPGDSGEP